MFTASQLSNFSLLLHYLCTTQTLFGDNPPIAFLDGSTGSLNSEGGVTSVLQFHQSFIDYCIRLKLANLLYQYLDFYKYGTQSTVCFDLKSLDILTLCLLLNNNVFNFARLCESAASIKELGMDVKKPPWVDMLIKCRLLGRNSRGI